MYFGISPIDISIGESDSPYEIALFIRFFVRVLIEFCLLQHEYHVQV